VPKSQAPILAIDLFKKFSTDQIELNPKELVKLQDHLDYIFNEEFRDLRPCSIFKTLELDDRGCANLDDFELWVMLYMTYDDEVDLLMSQ
jgi:hypothetical protein